MIYSENILICIAAPLLIAAIFLRGEARRFAVFFTVGMVICLLSAYISGFLEFAGMMEADKIPLYVSPVVEESMKVLPLIFVLLVIQPPEEGLFLGSVALGTGFATFENCCYILTAGSENLTYILVRGLAVGVMHLVCVLMVILGTILARRTRTFSLAAFVGALSTAMCYHSLYNLLVSQPGVTSIIGYVMPLFTVGVLTVPYRRIRKEI
ncbi:MAG: PrsW family intramembrane metalloprotease [Firmicutes bacterium]|jgi:RsiW-degrading membrane proteinase PrsW (M82 family)|nr:PrsW family intramembrane metalloprotease [Bacillota bacterium]